MWCGFAVLLCQDCGAIGGPAAVNNVDEPLGREVASVLESVECFLDSQPVGIMASAARLRGRSAVRLKPRFKDNGTPGRMPTCIQTSRTEKNMDVIMILIAISVAEAVWD